MFPSARQRIMGRLSLIKQYRQAGCNVARVCRPTARHTGHLCIEYAGKVPDTRLHHTPPHPHTAPTRPRRCLFLCWLPYAAGASPLEDGSSAGAGNGSSNGSSSNGTAAAADAPGGGVESAKDRTMYAVSGAAGHA